MSSCFRLGSRGRTDHRGRGGAQCGRDNPPSEVGHHRQVSKQPPSETQIRHLRMWVILWELQRVVRLECVCVRNIKKCILLGCFPCVYTIHNRWDPILQQILTSSRIRHFSRDSQPLWLVLSGESGVLLRQVASDIREHPRPLPQGRAPPHRECLSQGRGQWFATRLLKTKSDPFIKIIDEQKSLTPWPGLCGWVGVLGPERPLPRAVLRLHAAEGLLAPPGGGPWAGQG